MKHAVYITSLLSRAAHQYRARQYEQARASCIAALQSDPQNAHAIHLMGMAHYDEGDVEEAFKLFRKSIELIPESSGFQSNFGGMLARSGRYTESLQYLMSAITLDHKCFHAHNNLGVALEALGRLEEAKKALLDAVRINCEHAEAHFNLGNVLQKLKHPSDAVACYDQALKLQPAHIGSLKNSASLLIELGQMNRAMLRYREILELQPGDSQTHSSLLFALQYREEHTRLEIYAEHVAWGERHGAGLKSPAVGLTAIPRMNERRIKIGYVSPDFRSHPVSRFFEPVIKAHDSKRFEVICYSDVKVGDTTTQRLRRCAETWRDIAFMNDDELADRVREDQVDILIDLAGHMVGNRLLMFARRAAPVQASYIGYANTTGIAEMDYRITDSIQDPPGTSHRFYSEKLIHIEKCCWCYEPDYYDKGLRRNSSSDVGGTTFACLNRVAKITPTVVAAWAQILAAVEQSRLLVLAGPHEGYYESTRAMLADCNVEPDKITLVTRRTRDDYMELYNEIDISLDTFPYNGHTTTCDASWMGVPTISWAGNACVSRAGLDILSQLDCADLVAESFDEYVALAIELASDRDRLHRLHTTLRSRMMKSSLCDASGLCRRLEAAYKLMLK